MKNEHRNKHIIMIIMVIALLGTNAYWASTGTSPWNPPTEKVHVRLAYQIGFHYSQGIVMEHFDLVEKYSPIPVDVTYTCISSGTAITEAIAAEQLDFGAMGVPPAVLAVCKGVGVKILAGMGSMERTLWTWREEIQTIEDIKPPYKVNITRPESSAGIGLTKAFMGMGRTVEDVEAVSVYLSHPDGLSAMELREIDCDFTVAPYSTLYASDPAYHKIAGEKEIWGPIPGSVLLGTESFYEEYPDITAAVFSAWCEATTWLVNNPEDAADIIGDVYGFENAQDLWRESAPAFNSAYGLIGLKDFADTLYDLEIIPERHTNEELMFPPTLGIAGL